MGKKKKGLPEELANTNRGGQADVDLDQFNFEKDLATSSSKKSSSPEKTENTLRIVDAEVPTGSKGTLPRFDQLRQKTETKVSYGLPAQQNAPGNYPDRVMTSVEATLKQSEHLRIAQNKLNSLEEEVDKLRRENEALSSAGDTFKRINEEYYTTIEDLKQKITDQRQTSQQEIDLLKKIGKSKDKQSIDLRQQIDGLKSRLDNNFRGVRKREKDLEHRLEIAKIEEAAIVKSKDQLILDLKRRIDRITHESENFRQKSQENYRELQKKNQVVRGVIRALRIALTKLEGDDDSSAQDGDTEAAGGQDEAS